MSGVEILYDIPSIPGGSERQALDLYIPPATSTSDTVPRGVVVFVHGGAWRSNSRKTDAAVATALAVAPRSLPVALVGYRLSLGNDSDLRHPQHTRDVAAGIAVLVCLANGLVPRHLRQSEPGSATATLISLFGTWRPRDFHLIGFSAGATMGGLLCLRPSIVQDYINQYLCDWDEPLRPRWTDYVATFTGCEGIYDIPLLVKDFPTYEAWFIVGAIGAKDSGKWEEASPALAKTWEGGVPPPRARFLVLQSLGDELVNLAQAEAWVACLSALGVDATLNTSFSNANHDVTYNEAGFLDTVTEFINS